MSTIEALKRILKAGRSEKTPWSEDLDCLELLLSEIEKGVEPREAIGIKRKKSGRPPKPFSIKDLNAVIAVQRLRDKKLTREKAILEVGGEGRRSALDKNYDTYKHFAKWHISRNGEPLTSRNRAAVLTEYFDLCAEEGFDQIFHDLAFERSRSSSEE